MARLCSDIRDFLRIKHLTFCFFLVLACTQSAFAQATIKSVQSDDSYKSNSGQHLIMGVKIRTRWSSDGEFKLNGYLKDLKPNGLCVIKKGNDRCFGHEETVSAISARISKMNRTEKETLTEACYLISSDYETLISRTKNRNVRRLLEEQASVFRRLASKCQTAIRNTFPGTRFAKASASSNYYSSAVEGASGPKEFCGYKIDGVGLNNETIKSIQMGLKKRDLYSSAIDGEAGRGTCNAFKTFMEIEGTTDTFSKQILGNLKNNPSIWNIAKYNELKGSKKPNNVPSKTPSADPTEVLGSIYYTAMSVSPFDGKSSGQDYTGAWITFNGLVGSHKSSIAFEFAGNYPNQRVNSIGLSSVRSFPIAASVAERTNHPSLGNRFFINRSDFSDRRKFNNLVRSLDARDKAILKTICGTLTNQNTVDKIVEKMADNPFNTSYQTYWSASSRSSEIMQLAKQCTQALGIGAYDAAPQFIQSNANAVLPTAADSGSSCRQSKNVLRSVQATLKSFGFYQSTLDGIDGPGTQAALLQSHYLLGEWSNGNICMSISEQKLLDELQSMKRASGAECNLHSRAAAIEQYNALRGKQIIEKSIKSPDNLPRYRSFLKEVVSLEKDLEEAEFYSKGFGSKRDCQLNASEIKALTPAPVPTNGQEDPAGTILEPIVSQLSSQSGQQSAEEETPANTESVITENTTTSDPVPVNVALQIDGSNLSAQRGTETDNVDVTRLSLTITGDQIESSKMNKSLFGRTNSASMEAQFSLSQTDAYLDLIIDESQTKINLHLTSDPKKFAQDISDLRVDTKEGWSAFFVRLRDNGSSNIGNGDFARVLDEMPQKDRVLIAAFCQKFADITSDREVLVETLDGSTSVLAFKTSPLSSEKALQILNGHANACVAEVKKRYQISAAFQETQIPPGGDCTFGQELRKDELLKEKNKIDEEIQDLAGAAEKEYSSRINLDKFMCSQYEPQSQETAAKIDLTEEKLTDAQEQVIAIETEIENARGYGQQLAALSTAEAICDEAQSDLRARIVSLIKTSNPTFSGLSCQSTDEAEIDPFAILIKEQKEQIRKLKEKHISPDETSELKMSLDNLRTLFSNLEAEIAAASAGKVRQDEISDKETEIAALTTAITSVEADYKDSKEELDTLKALKVENAAKIDLISGYNNELVDLTGQKSKFADTLEGLNLEISRRQSEIDDLIKQIKDAKSEKNILDIQLEAANAAVTSLKQEVSAMETKISQTRARVDEIEKQRDETKAIIENANEILAQKSPLLITTENEISEIEKRIEALIASTNLLAPQADASEETVLSLKKGITEKYVTLEEYNAVQEELGALTKEMTEQSNFIQQLEKDYNDILSDQESLFKKCLSDSKCKNEMSERLGVD